MSSLLTTTEGKTLLSVSSRDKEIAEKTGINKTEQAKLVGKLAAEKSKSSGITDSGFRPEWLFIPR